MEPTTNVPIKKRNHFNTYTNSHSNHWQSIYSLYYIHTKNTLINQHFIQEKDNQNHQYIRTNNFTLFEHGYIGQIDELYFNNVASKQKQIYNNVYSVHKYNNNNNNLILHFGVNDGINNITKDSTNNYNDATIINFDISFWKISSLNLENKYTVYDNKQLLIPLYGYTTNNNNNVSYTTNIYNYIECDLNTTHISIDIYTQTNNSLYFSNNNSLTFLSNSNNSYLSFYGYCNCIDIIYSLKTIKPETSKKLLGKIIENNILQKDLMNNYI